MINERQIALRKGGNFTNLDNFFDRRIVKSIPFVVTQEIAISTAQFGLIPSTILTGTIAVGTSSVSNGSYIAAALSGAVGTAATTTISDSLGNILNMVSIRDTNGDPLKEGAGVNAKTIYGLIQCSSGTADGASIGGVGSENLQISFVYDNAGTLTLATALDQSIQFQANKLFTQRNVPVIEKESGSIVPDILGQVAVPVCRKFIVTTAFVANEVITLSTGAGASAGASTPSGDTVTLPASDAAMVADNTCRIRLNGVQQRKGSGNDFVWDSTTTGHFTSILDVGDYFEIEKIIQA
jgi:hypothetical protein